MFKRTKEEKFRRSCVSHGKPKQRHWSKRAANEHAVKLIRSGFSKGYHAYFCPYCTKEEGHEVWHVGKGMEES